MQHPFKSRRSDQLPVATDAPWSHAITHPVYSMCQCIEGIFATYVPTPVGCYDAPTSNTNKNHDQPGSQAGQMIDS